MRANAWWHCALLAATAACGTSEPDADVADPGYGPGLGTPENPIPQHDVTYAVRSRIGPDAGASVPLQVVSVVASLRAFAESPAQTLIAIAAAAGLPEIDQLYGTLPSSLTTQLVGWIDTELDAVAIDGKPVRDYAAELAAFAESALTRFTLESTMSFTPLRTVHTLTGIAFDLSTIRVVVPIGGLKADVIGQQVPVSVAEGGLITFGDHEFGLAFGEHVWHGINLASSTVFGVDVQTALVDTVDCLALSQAVASKCVNGQCVGHQSELNTICERSLDLLVTDLSERIGAFDSDVLHYVAGTARLVDENRDGLANRIADGVWDSELTMGPARGTFTASAEGR